jgi:hypothetical protein
MNNEFRSLTKSDLETVNGGGFIATGLGMLGAAVIVGGTATVVYVAGKGVKKVGDYIISKF